MSVDINLYLKNSGGNTSRAKSKLSAKTTFNNKKGRVTSSKKDINNMGALATFMSSGNIATSGAMKVPILRTVMVIGKVADKAVNFTTALYQARSGEQMISSNVKSYSKVATTLGLYQLEGAIDNYLYRKPTVERQNYMIDYGRKLYTQNVENKKNKFS